MMADKKQIILSRVEDLISDFLYYHRKEDGELQRGEIELAIKSGLITKDDIVSEFKRQLDRGVE